MESPFFFKSDLKFSVISPPPDLESIWCKLYLDKKTIIISVFYRPPASSPDTLFLLADYINTRSFHASSIILMGDFNTPDIHWPSLSHRSSLGSELINFSLSFGLTQVVDGATRQNAVLHLVFVSSDLVDKLSECEISDGISDHKAVFITLSCTVCKPHTEIKTFLDFNHSDDASILEVLSEGFEPFCTLSKDCDVNRLVREFESITKLCIHRFVPLKSKKKNRTIPWITREILQLSRRIRRPRRSKRSNNPDAIARFTSAQRGT